MSKQPLPDDVPAFKRKIVQLQESLQKAMDTSRLYEQTLATAKQQAEKAIENELRFKTLFESACDYALVIELLESAPPMIVDANEAALAKHGYTRDEMIAEPITIIDKAMSAKEIADRVDLLNRGQLVHFETTHTCKDGSTFLVEAAFRMVEVGGKRLVYSVERDITERKKTEIALAHANRALTALGTVNRELVRATDEIDLLRAICRAIVEQRGYRMAWVGYARDNADKDIELMSSAGVPKDALEEIRPGWGDDPRAVGPTGRAVRTGKTQLSQDIASEPHHDWKDAMLKAGCASSIALPLKGESGDAFGLLHVYADEINAFADGEIRLLEEMADDLAFGVNALRARLERDDALKLNEQHLVQLRQNLDETIVAITKAVDARDPYTAGHQRRVAKLAVAIARRMGLDEDALQGIHMGAMIHDIGKINIPAEILSKPTRLNEMEYMMVKMHSKIGYDILKDVHFPWPVAEVAYQHHEHIDGSGYPQGLKGEQICLEARIVAVADVVEAMTSHRPYRPGLGHEAAIAEINDYSGIRYDADAVHACLAVFADGFRFDD